MEQIPMHVLLDCFNQFRLGGMELVFIHDHYQVFPTMSARLPLKYFENMFTQFGVATLEIG